jgi:hypothetical protein
MATLYSPRIVTDGLVVCLDAGNRKSYPGSGTTWFDLSGNGSNGTLTNGPTFDSANGGSISFDGVNDDVVGSTIDVTGQITVSAWINHNSITSGYKRYLMLSDETAVIRQDTTAGQLQFYIRTSGTLRFLQVSNQLVANTWYYIVGTWNGTNMRFYRNAIQIASSNPGGTMASAQRTYRVSADSESMNGRIALASVYNRGLTAAEVLQNFNATRSRFGV